MTTTLVSVFEHAWLTTDDIVSSMHCAQVSQSAFDYLCTLSESFFKSGARLSQIDGIRRLKLDSFVGVIQTPCGTTIEIVPKNHSTGGSLAESRLLLRKLLLSQLNINNRDVGEAPIMLFDSPVTEWVISRFLHELETLLGQGLRFDYKRIEDSYPYLKGQLNLMAQLRQPPGQDHIFNIRHDIYSPDRAENRLLKSALEIVRKVATNRDNWRLAHELSYRINEITPSKNIALDLKTWGNDRLMTTYRAIKPWCELILNHLVPVAVLGLQNGLSLLFPMEKLFEGFVAQWFRKNASSNTVITSPARSEALCTHQNEPIFKLEPDILITSHDRKLIADTKWKLIDTNNRKDKYGLSQSDFYQLFAYGHKYLGGKGDMILIFPKTERFTQPLAPFNFGESLTLHALPFDLNSENLIGYENLGCCYLL